MTISHALILGLIQGLAEMLPISSSAHLVLLPWLFHFPDPGLAFDVALHIGTLLALLIYFWSDWRKLAKSVLTALKRRQVKEFEERLAVFLLVASIPGAVFGAILDKYAENSLRSPLLIAFTLTALGALLLYADKIDKGQKSLKSMNYRDSFKIGLAQALAIIPGVSRSGITNTTGLLLGFDRESAVRFSFLMSAPIIAGAGLMKLKDLGAGELASLPFWIAFVAATASSLFAINFLLGYVKKHGFSVFAYYRFALSAAIILLLIFRG